MDKTQTRNEAAERLSRFLGIERREELQDLGLHNLLDEALDAERRATVERIRHRVHRIRYQTSLTMADIKAIEAILDEEAAR